jgi:hypothetical protein
MIGTGFIILYVGAVGLIMNLGGFRKEKILVLSEELLISLTEYNNLPCYHVAYGVLRGSASGFIT